MNNIIDNLLNTPTHIREAQQKAIDSDTIYVSVASGKTEREAVVMTRENYRLTRRRNYGTCLSRISPYRA